MQLAGKKIAAPFILAAFLAVAFFGFVAMSYGTDGRMQGDCPFSATGIVLCPQDTLIVAIHHISAYQSFLNVPVDSTVLVLLSLMMLSLYLLILFTQPVPRILTAHTAHFSHGPPVSARTRKITRWLSLLEHSPS